MSTKIMALCWPLSMPPTAKAVLVSLADNANDHGECWPSIPTISERTCFSERAVQNAIAWLESAKALVADRSNGRRTRYTIKPEAFQPPQETHPRRRCTPAGDAPTPAANAGDPRRRCTQPPQEVPSNRKEPSKNRQRTVIAEEFSPPEWIPSETWKAYLKARTKKRADNNPHALSLIVKDLEAMRLQGLDALAALEASVKNGWAGVFPPKGGAPPKEAPWVSANRKTVNALTGSSKKSEVIDVIANRVD